MVCQSRKARRRNAGQRPSGSVQTRQTIKSALFARRCLYPFPVIISPVDGGRRRNALGSDMTHMSLREKYPTPDIDPCWSVAQNFDAHFDWTYDPGRGTLMKLYQKGKDMQWDAVDRIDWSIALGEENPLGLPDAMFGIYHTPIWSKMSARERTEFRQHIQSWFMSQFLQGEQAAMICAAKTVQEVPDLDAKFYASTQVMDEARHVEAFRKIVDRMGVAYPMTRPLQELIDQALRDTRWDMTYLAMQVVIEGLALAAFTNIREVSTNALARQINAFVMQDEARHVAFGRITLADYYPQLSQAERDEREDFLIEASHLMGKRFGGREVYETLGLPVEECLEAVAAAPGYAAFQRSLFQRIVPTVRDIGLWSDKIQKAYQDLGVFEFATHDSDALVERDEACAAECDAENHEARAQYIADVAEQGRRASTA